MAVERAPVHVMYLNYKSAKELDLLHVDLDLIVSFLHMYELKGISLGRITALGGSFSDKIRPFFLLSHLPENTGFSGPVSNLH
jgi:hypothetical protein